MADLRAAAQQALEALGWAAGAAAWDQFDPCGLLERLVAVGETE